VVEDDGIRRNRQSGVLDAIFEAVEDKPASPELQASPFRAAALARLNVPEQVDTLLPIISRRTWLAAVGVVLAIVAFLVYAAATTTVTAISTQGRAVAEGGIVQAVSPEPGVILELSAQSGAAVDVGSPLASGVTADGSAFDVRAPLNGTLWQVLVLAGGAVERGDTVATILPEGSDRSVLVALPESEAATAAAAVRVDLSIPGQGTVAARVVSVSSAPVPADIAVARTALPVDAAAQMVMVSLEPAAPLRAGADISVTFVLSERTLLQGMLGIS
jgi:multidrug efflux pump subunit AcrA (membrane-fusion protein)